MTTTVLAYIPSPSQGVWHLGPVPIRAYALFIIVGIIVALVLGDRRWVARGGESGVVYDIALWAVPFGLIGGRLYHVITDWRTYFGDDGAGFAGALRIWDGGLGIWGAVALGGVGAWIGCRQRGIPLPAFGDAIAPGIVLAQAIGRLGNYFNQELYGRPTTLPWGLEIYERRDTGGALDSLNGVSTGQLVEVVHPTFLYELLWNLLVFAALIYIDRRFKIGHGRLFAMYVAGYCVGRFWIELMRSDVATHIAGIRVNSFTSTFVFIGAVVYIMLAPKGREEPATLRGKQADAAEDEEDTVIDDFVKELTAVGATTGVVAAAKAAGEAEAEDAKAAAGGKVDDEDRVDDEDKVDDEAEEPSSEAAAEAEELAYDVAEAPADDIAEAEEFAAAKDEAESALGGVGAVEGEEAVEAEEAAPEVHDAAVEATDEAEEVADEVAAEDEEPAAEVEAEAEGEAEAAESAGEDEEPAADDTAEDDASEGEEPAAEGEAGGESVGGVGAVEGEEAVEAEEAAPEVHDAAVEAVDEAEEVADEVAAEDEEPAAEDTAVEAEGVESVAEEPAAKGEAEGEAVGGVGAVEGEELAEAEEAAPAVHEAVVEAADKANDVAAEVEAEPEGEPETEDAEAAVENTDAERSPEEAADEAEAVADAAGEAAEDEPSTGVLAAEAQTATPAKPLATEQLGSRLRRLLRRNR